MKTVLIAPNAFKNSLGAVEVSEAIARGLDRSALKVRCLSHAVADGGDGTAALLIRHLHGETVSSRARDPLGREGPAQFGIVGARTAVVEMAEASGLRRLHPSELNPLRATSFGTGDLIKAALDRGAREILLAVGGSATVDAGFGLLQALGMRFLDASGSLLTAMPEALLALDRIDVSGLDARMAASEIVVLCDVDNPLLGPNGAAPIFGPQKGAALAGVETLDAALTRFSDVVFRQTGQEISNLARGGAAGGIAAGLHALLGAKLVNGIDYFLDVSGFDANVRRASLVITGEGRIDDQTLHGKAPLGVAKRARRHGIAVVAFAGSVPRSPSAALQSAFDALMPVCPEPIDLADALRNTAQNVERTALTLGNLLAMGRRF